MPDAKKAWQEVADKLADDWSLAVALAQQLLPQGKFQRQPAYTLRSEPLQPLVDA